MVIFDGFKHELVRHLAHISILLTIETATAVWYSSSPDFYRASLEDSYLISEWVIHTDFLGHRTAKTIPFCD